MNPSNDGSLKPTDSPACASDAVAEALNAVGLSPTTKPDAKATPSNSTATADAPRLFGWRPSTAPSAASGRIYSPTTTEDWLYCPMYRALRRTWAPERTDWDPARLLGTSLNAGLTEHWRHLRAGTFVDTTPYWDAIQETAFAALRHEWQECDLTLGGAEKLVSRGLQEALGAPLVASGAEVLRVDESLGVSRPDLILRNPQGLAVWDLKTARSLDARYVQERLSGYDTLWQLYHGAWEAEQYYGEPVVEVGIMQVILSPRAQCLLHPIVMDPKHLEQWAQSAEQIWKDMESEETGNRPVVQRYTSCEKRRFGRARCEFHAACHTCYLDETQMARIYDRIPPRAGLER